MANTIVWLNIVTYWIFLLTSIIYISVEDFEYLTVEEILGVFLVLEPFVYFCWYIRLTVLNWAAMSIVQKVFCFPIWIFLTLLSTFRLITSIPELHKWSFMNCLSIDITLGDSKFYNYLHKNRLFWFT